MRHIQHTFNVQFTYCYPSTSVVKVTHTSNIGCQRNIVTWKIPKHKRTHIQVLCTIVKYRSPQIKFWGVFKFSKKYDHLSFLISFRWKVYIFKTHTKKKLLLINSVNYGQSEWRIFETCFGIKKGFKLTIQVFEA